MEKNYVNQVRPASTFENFKPCNADLKKALKFMADLTEQIILKKDLTTDEYPFANANLVILFGKPGRGKTFLVEALINEIRLKKPKILKRIYLSRYDFTLQNIASISRYDDCPIIIIDDFWGDKHSIEELNLGSDIAVLAKFISMIYEQRRLVIFTTNFSLKDGLLEKIRELDKTGRIISRLTKLLSRCGELELTGDDYRLKLATQNKTGKFSI